jgi:hypothetical protein
MSDAKSEGVADGLRLPNCNRRAADLSRLLLRLRWDPSRCQNLNHPPPQSPSNTLWTNPIPSIDALRART